MFQKLGQHFLINKSAIHKIILALNLRPNDTVIEIGPGKGALTFPLIKECQKIGCKIIAIEKDPKLGLRAEGLGDRKDFKIIIGDALKEIPKITKPYTLNPIPYKIVGNIPFYITGKLLRILSELENKPELTVLMIQKEVAERLCAEPKGMNPVRGRSSQDDRSHSPSARTASNGMNLLAAAVQFWAKPEILFTLKPDNFSPPPKVESTVIKLTTLRPKPHTINPEIYYKLIHIIFKQPRKTVFNNLKTGLKMPPKSIENHLKSLGIDPKSRPQNLSITQIINFVRSDLTK